jgi:hypothetical protein
MISRCRATHGLQMSRHHMLQWQLIVCRLGHLQTITWAVWAARVRHPGRRQLYTFLLLLNAATLLEVSSQRLL